MAEWDFESALKDYFGGGSSGDGRPTTEDGDAPLGVAPRGPAGSAGGSATFSAPSGWDFDKALNDYFGVNGYAEPSRYFAPRGDEFSDTRGIGAPEDFGLRHLGFVPSPPMSPPPTDYEQAAWFNAMQRRHVAWEAEQERQAFPLNTLLAQPTATPTRRIPPPTPVTPTRTPTPTGTPTLTPMSTPTNTPALTPSPTGTPRLTQTSIPTNPLTGWLASALDDLNRRLSVPPTSEEVEALKYLPLFGHMPYGGHVLGNLLEPLAPANEWARQNVPVVGGLEDIVGNAARTISEIPLWAPWGRPYDLAAALSANYQGLDPSVYEMLSNMRTVARLEGNMPGAYGQGPAGGFTYPGPLAITLADKPGQPPPLPTGLHEASHAVAFRDFGGFPMQWEGPVREFHHVFFPKWDAFIDAVQSYKGNSDPQYKEVNEELTDKPDPTINKKGSYGWTNPMEMYARIAELSNGDLNKIPPEFKKFYTWLQRGSGGGGLVK